MTEEVAKRVIGGVFVGVDVQAHTPAEDRARASEARLQAVLRSTSDVIAIQGLNGVLRYVSPSVAHVLGFRETALVGRTFASLVVGADSLATLQGARAQWHLGAAATVELKVRHASGEAKVVELSGTNLIDDPVIAGIVLTFRDITDRRLAEGAAARAMAHDQMTGLPNRLWLTEHARARTDAAATAAVILVNLDGFSLINATYGEPVGNRVLHEVAHRLVRVEGSEETVCRLGSDEFAILCVGHEVSDLDAAAARYVAALTDEVLVLEGQGIWLSASAGITPPSASGDIALLLRQADAATRSAKAKGPGRVEVFGVELEGVASRRLEVESGLRAALAEGQLRLHYQPVVNMHSGVIKGVEALVRWLHPREGLLGPGAFLPTAEQSRLIVDIGRWVLSEACTQAAAWERTWPERRLSVAVNLSARHLLDPRLVDDVQAALDVTGVTPARIRLEITETSVMAEADAAVRTLRRLKATGVRISIDDFGTGWSSLAYLKNLPVDELKIDRSFVMGLGVDAGDAVIVASVVGLAEALGLDIVAEGVETVRQHDALVRHGVHHAQGYLWSQPLPPDEMTLLLGRDESYVGIARQLDEPGVAFTEPNADLLSMLAHELRNPLTVINGFSELLGDRADAVDPEVLNALSAIGRNARLAATLIQSISDLARLDDGTLPLLLSTVDLSALVANLVADAQQTMNGMVTLEGPRTPILVHADELRIQQIVWNLLSNAMKFGGAGKPIVVRVFSDLDAALVEVVDAGPGIPVEDAARMFRKYSRLSQTGSGTGLGLFLSHRLAEAQGGALEYEAVATGGSRFRFSMPSPQPAL